MDKYGHLIGEFRLSVEAILSMIRGESSRKVLRELIGEQYGLTLFLMNKMEK